MSFYSLLTMLNHCHEDVARFMWLKATIYLSLILSLKLCCPSLILSGDGPKGVLWLYAQYQPFFHLSVGEQQTVLRNVNHNETTTYLYTCILYDCFCSSISPLAADSLSLANYYSILRNYYILSSSVNFS